MPALKMRPLKSQALTVILTKKVAPLKFTTLPARMVSYPLVPISSPKFQPPLKLPLIYPTLKMKNLDVKAAPVLLKKKKLPKPSSKSP